MAPQRFVFRSARVAAALGFAVGGLALVGWDTGAGAHESTQQLLRQAVHDTNTVRTLTHRDRFVSVNGSQTVTAAITGEEDEVLNREQDYEAVTVRDRDPKGLVKHLHYTATVVFLNGHTYYRLSLNHNVWKKGKGMVFHDPFTQGMQRARTTVTYPSGSRFVTVPGSGSLVHLRAIAKTAQQVSRTELWISRGAKPYVVRELRDIRALGSSHNRLLDDAHFVSFNQQLVITAPATST